MNQKNKKKRKKIKEDDDEDDDNEEEEEQQQNDYYFYEEEDGNTWPMIPTTTTASTQNRRKKKRKEGIITIDLIKEEEEEKEKEAQQEKKQQQAAVVVTHCNLKKPEEPTVDKDRNRNRKEEEEEGEKESRETVIEQPVIKMLNDEENSRRQFDNSQERKKETKEELVNHHHPHHYPQGKPVVVITPIVGIIDQKDQHRQDKVGKLLVTKNDDEKLISPHDGDYYFDEEDWAIGTNRQSNPTFTEKSATVTSTTTANQNLPTSVSSSTLETTTNSILKSFQQEEPLGQSLQELKEEEEEVSFPKELIKKETKNPSPLKTTIMMMPADTNEILQEKDMKYPEIHQQLLQNTPQQPQQQQEPQRCKSFQEEKELYFYEEPFTSSRPFPLPPPPSSHPRHSGTTLTPKKRSLNEMAPNGFPANLNNQLKQRIVQGSSYNNAPSDPQKQMASVNRQLKQSSQPIVQGFSNTRAPTDPKKPTGSLNSQSRQSSQPLLQGSRYHIEPPPDPMKQKIFQNLTDEAIRITTLIPGRSPVQYISTTPLNQIKIANLKTLLDPNRLRLLIYLESSKLKSSSSSSSAPPVPPAPPPPHPSLKIFPPPPFSSPATFKPPTFIPSIYPSKRQSSASKSSSKTTIVFPQKASSSSLNSNQANKSNIPLPSTSNLLAPQPSLPPATIATSTASTTQSSSSSSLIPPQQSFSSSNVVPTCQYLNQPPPSTPYFLPPQPFPSYFLVLPPQQSSNPLAPQPFPPAAAIATSTSSTSSSVLPLQQSFSSANIVPTRQHFSKEMKRDIVWEYLTGNYHSRQAYCRMKGISTERLDRWLLKFQAKGNTGDINS